ncbi:MAG: glutathione S-transferase N-terminal domain-containing protein, partial [Burkholderiales bacterium]
LLREALTELDLDALIHPCPEGGSRFRPIAQAKGGKMQFPFLVDPNTGRSLYESADIVVYLSETYGSNIRSGNGLLRKLSVAGSYLATGVRMPCGLRARPSKAPAQSLELYSMDASPYCRLVRETLCELELPYLLRNTGKGSRNRKTLLDRAGKVQLPYLIDANTGREMFESPEIVRHLEQTYALTSTAV